MPNETGDRLRIACTFDRADFDRVQERARIANIPFSTEVARLVKWALSTTPKPVAPGSQSGASS